MVSQLETVSVYSQPPDVLAPPHLFKKPHLLSYEPKIEFQRDSKWEWLFTGKGINNVILDLESTLTRVEAFKVWGNFLGEQASNDLSSITSRVQSGQLDFNVGVRARLEIARPNRKMIRMAEAKYPVQLVPYAQEVIQGLKLLGKDPQIVSGGFDNTMGKIRETFGIPIHASRLFFDRFGNYSGYFDGGRLVQSNGKNHMVWKLDRQGKVEQPFAVVGDGMPDMEIESASLKIGVCVCEYREEVKNASDIYITELAPLLVILAGENGWRKLAGCKDWHIRETFVKGVKAIMSERVYFKDAALEALMIAKLRKFIDPRWDRDVINPSGTVFRYGYQSTV